MGPTNSLVDVAGVRVGHAHRIGEGWRTGVTVVLPPPEGAVCGVDVRGAAPGTRETDLLDPRNLVERVHALVFAGGSAYGLAAATGVMESLADDGVGFPVKDAVVPIVPAAVIFDLGRGGLPRLTPGPAFGATAYHAAGSGAVPQGNVGAGAGAALLGGQLAGGVGSASAVVGPFETTPTSGDRQRVDSEGPYRATTVAALAVANAAGSPLDLDTGLLYASHVALPGEYAELGPVDGAKLAEWRSGLSGPGTFNTVIGVVATDAVLTKSQCARLAGAGHDGLARAVRPAHLMTDGDAIFGLATAAGAVPDLLQFNALLGTAADVFARAVGHAVLAATGWPGVPSYREVCGNAAGRPQ
jgi:putative pantetheine hydrolase